MARSTLPSNRYTTTLKVIGASLHDTKLAICTTLTELSVQCCQTEVVARIRAALGDGALDFRRLALEHDAEFRAHARLALDAYAAAHGLDHMLHDR